MQNKLSKFNYILIVIVILVVSGCGVGKIVATGKDSYMITGFNSAPFSTGTGVLTKLYEKAGNHCSEQSLIIHTVKTYYRNQVPMRPARAELAFRCLSEDDPELEQKEIVNK